MTFKELGIIPDIIKALKEKGYEKPTPIQAQSIPVLLEQQDLLGAAQTGTGKTAAFTLPILQLLSQKAEIDKGKRVTRALIVTPTRELANQILQNLNEYSKYIKVYSMAIYGGVSQNTQIKKYNRGADVIVATPGRLIDLIVQNLIDLSAVEHFVLDEVDQMLDMGFIRDIQHILQTIPKERQTLFFSATMPKTITRLANSILVNPHRVTINPEKQTAERVEQSVYLVNQKSKAKLLIEVLNSTAFYNAIIFTRTKYGADKVARVVGRNGFKTGVIHGNKSQNQRERTLESFKKGKLNVLVATDIAARGLDIKDLSLVINFDLPNIPESYVHRIGRTGRAEASGVAISLCNKEQMAFLKDIEDLIKFEIPIVTDHSFAHESENYVKPSGQLEMKKSDSKKSKSGGGPQQNKRKPQNNRNQKRTGRPKGNLTGSNDQSSHGNKGRSNKKKQSNQASSSKSSQKSSNANRGISVNPRSNKAKKRRF